MTAASGPYCWACWHTHRSTPRGRAASVGQPCTRCRCDHPLTRSPSPAPGRAA